MNKKIRIGIASILILLIIVIGIISYINKDTLFTNIVKIEYSDGCIEEYKNGEIITPICEEGRRLAEEKELCSDFNFNYNG